MGVIPLHVSSYTFRVLSHQICAGLKPSDLLMGGRGGGRGTCGNRDPIQFKEPKAKFLSQMSHCLNVGTLSQELPQIPAGRGTSCP